MANPLRSLPPLRRPDLRSPLLALAVLLVGAMPAGATARDEAHRTIHLLEYVAVDYPAAVSDGRVVSELEYAEQLDFIEQVRHQLDRLGVSAGDPLRAELAALERAVRERAPAEVVARHAGALAAGLRERFGVKALPTRPPDLARGHALYQQYCASCHGPTGRGDGPAGQGLEPPPSDFTNRERMLSLSPSSLYSTITFGIEGTGMAGFADRLDEAARHDLAFYVGSLAFREDEVARGAALIEGSPERAAELVPDLATLADRPAAAWAGDPDALALVAYLRTHPEALRRGELPLDIARARLEESWAAYRAGRRDEALDLAISAYLDGFEPVEPALDAVDGALRLRVEEGFLRYRQALREGRPPEEVAPLVASLEAELGAAEARLDGGGLDRVAAFVSSFVIAAREGLEAVLLIVALCTVLIRAGRREALRWVHAGWITALGAGALTWGAANHVVRVSGASREVIEGITALLAAAILFYVSYWLVSRTSTARWQAFLHQRMRQALSRGSLWTLALVSFVAVYREAFETVLFYQALFAQAGPGATREVVLGIVAGLVMLAAMSLVIFRFGLRLPMRRFFTVSSLLLYTLAVILAGHGVAALQEAGWLPATFVPGPRLEWIGVYPTVEGLVVQGILVLAAVAAFVVSRSAGAAVPARSDAASGAG